MLLFLSLSTTKEVYKMEGFYRQTEGWAKKSLAKEKRIVSVQVILLGEGKAGFSSGR